jgi:hypothetical protein
MAERIVMHSQNDFRHLLNILEEIKMLYTEEISFSQLDLYFDTSIMKDCDSGIFEITEMLLSRYNGVKRSIELHSEERATIPLMIHQNIGNNIMTVYTKLSWEQQAKMYYEINKSMAYADYIDGNIYSNQLWFLQPVHGFYACVCPSYIFNQFPKKKLNIKLSCNYTTNYNKTSIKKINNKVIKTAQSNSLLRDMNVDDFLYFSLIAKSFSDDENNIELKKIADEYKLTIKEIESIMKIDKIKA